MKTALHQKQQEVVELVLKLDQKQLTRVGAKLRAEISGTSARRPKTENSEWRGPKWAKDKWYECHYC